MPEPLETPVPQITADTPAPDASAGSPPLAAPVPAVDAHHDAPALTPTQQAAAAYAIDDSDEATVAGVNPPAPTMPAPAAPKHPKYLRELAADQGFTAEEIDAIPSDILGSMIRRNQKAFLEQRKQQTAADTIAPDRAPPNPPPVPEEDPFATEVTGEDGAVTKLGKKDFHKGIVQAYEKLADKLKAALTKIDALENLTVAKENLTFADRADAALAKHETHLGKGTRHDLQQDSPEWARRHAVMKLVLEDKSHRSVEEKIDRVVKTLYGETKPDAEKPKPDAETKRWQDAQLQRPTQRQTRNEPGGVEKAKASVARIIREGGAGTADENGQADATDFPE